MASSSQMDIFEDSDKVTLKEVSLSNPEKMSTAFDYKWCIFFNWDEETKNPFQLFVLNMFMKNEIREPWIAGNLGDQSRMRKLRNFKKLPGLMLSLFAKIPKGLFITILSLNFYLISRYSF